MTSSSTDSETVQVTGGNITLRAMGALPPRQRKRIKPYIIALGGKLERIGNAATVVVDGQLADTSSVLAGADVSLSLAEARLFDDMQDETTIALLAGWSFAAPLPATIDQLLDVDDVTGQVGLYDEISTAVARRMAASVIANGFELTPENLADPASPTGASAA